MKHRAIGSDSFERNFWISNETKHPSSNSRLKYVQNETLMAHENYSIGFLKRNQFLGIRVGIMCVVEYNKLFFTSKQ